MNKDQIKEEFEKKFSWFFSGTIADDARDQILAHLSAQYEKLIEEVLPEEVEYGSDVHIAYANGFNDCLSTIRTSLQERGIKIK